MKKNTLLNIPTPRTPPSKEVFKHWVEVLKQNAHDLEEIQKKSLVELGIEMAKSSTDFKVGESWHAPKAISSIKDIEKAMGLESESSVKLFLSKIDIASDQIDQQSIPSFSPSSMQSILDGSKSEVTERVKILLRDPFFKYDLNPDKDFKRKKTLDQVKALADQGLGSYAFPKKYGGGGRVGDHITVFETLAYGDLSLLIKFGVQFGLFGGSVFNLGTEKHHRKYVDLLGKADLLGCFAMTETGHGSNVKGLETTAIYNHEMKTITINSPSHESGKRIYWKCIAQHYGRCICSAYSRWRASWSTCYIGSCAR